MWTGDDDPAVAATDAAIRRTAALGGPRDFTATDPVPLLEGDPPEYRHETRHGLDVAVQDATGDATGFLAGWETTVPRSSPPAPCDALADWVIRVLDDAAQRPRVVSACRDALAAPPHETGVFATSAGGSDGPGRDTVGTATRSLADEGTSLYVVLSFDPRLSTLPTRRAAGSPSP